MPTSQAITFEQRVLRAAETAISFPLGPGIVMMTFRGIAQQVAAVRRFVESEIRDHPALDNAVLVQPQTGADPPGPAWRHCEGADRKAGPREAGAGDLVTRSAATSTPGDAVVRVEGILRVNIARLITGSPGKMEV